MIVLSVLLTGIPLITFLYYSLTISFWSPFQNCWASKPKEATILPNNIIFYVIIGNTDTYSLSYALLHT